MLSLISRSVCRKFGCCQRAFSTQQGPSVSLQAKLFTPGPLNTTERVRQAANFDYGSRDPKFIQVVKDIRQSILDICKVQKGKYECVIMQGSGTFGVESVIGTSIPKNDKQRLLVCANGAYGERIGKMAAVYGIRHEILKYQDNQVVDAQDVLGALKKHKDITHVAVIHSETTSGIINPIQEIGNAVKSYNKDIIYIVDSMSSFGAYEIFPDKCGIDYLVSSSNKNLQGIPGFSFIVAKTDVLSQTKDNARSLALDLYAQWDGLEKTGQFRFTPPTHVLRATYEAILEFNEKGGVQGRSQRYIGNQKLLYQEMTKLGFKVYIDQKYQGCIITTFLQPNHKNFVFNEFYEFLASKQLVIYPGKLTVADTFRIGSIGEIYQQDILQLVIEIKSYLQKAGIPIPVPY